MEDDFFGWHSIQGNVDVEMSWQSLARQFEGYDLSLIDEDILKPLYEQLVDPETRHDLGEYYTPDWLADRVVKRTLDDWPNWQT